MALIKCPECNKEISDTSRSCIHCGYKLKNVCNLNINKKALIIIGIIILMIIMFIIKNNTKEKLPYCYETEYFYKQIKDEIHDEYWQYDIDIEYCNSHLLNGELDAWCHFKYKKKEAKNYTEKEVSKTFNCSHTK